MTHIHLSKIDPWLNLGPPLLCLIPDFHHFNSFKESSARDSPTPYPSRIRMRKNRRVHSDLLHGFDVNSFSSCNLLRVSYNFLKRHLGRYFQGLYSRSPQSKAYYSLTSASLRVETRDAVGENGPCVWFIEFGHFMPQNLITGSPLLGLSSAIDLPLKESEKWPLPPRKKSISRYQTHRKLNDIPYYGKRTHLNIFKKERHET